ncbi:hypothetical protein LQL77_29760 [Rhodococcus cerastii]|nr:hypothetical protein [Rhodococcus cerastii]
MNASDHEWETDRAYHWRRIVELDRDRENWARSFDRTLVDFLATVSDPSVMVAHELDLTSEQWVPEADPPCLDWVTSHARDGNILEATSLPPNFGNPSAMVLRVQDLSLIHRGRDGDAATAQQALAYTFSHNMLRTEGGGYEIRVVEKSATRDVTDLLAAIDEEGIGATVREAPTPVVDIAQRLDLGHADRIGVPDPVRGPFSFVDDPCPRRAFHSRSGTHLSRGPTSVRRDAHRSPSASGHAVRPRGSTVGRADKRGPHHVPPWQRIGDWAEHERRVDAITEVQTMERHAALLTEINAAALAREVRELTPDFPRAPPESRPRSDPASPMSGAARSRAATGACSTPPICLTSMSRSSMRTGTQSPII